MLRGVALLLNLHLADHILQGFEVALGAFGEGFGTLGAHFRSSGANIWEIENVKKQKSTKKGGVL